MPETFADNLPGPAPGMLDKILAQEAAIATPPGLAPPAAAPINPSVIQGYLVTLGIAIASVTSIWAAAVHFWQARDLAGALNYIRGSAFLGALTPISAVVSLALMFWRTRRSINLKAWLASRLDNHIAYVVGVEKPSLPPSRAPETVTGAAGERMKIVGMPVDLSGLVPTVTKTASSRPLPRNPAAEPPLPPSSEA